MNVEKQKKIYLFFSISLVTVMIFIYISGVNTFISSIDDIKEVEDKAVVDYFNEKERVIESTERSELDKNGLVNWNRKVTLVDGYLVYLNVECEKEESDYNCEVEVLEEVETVE